MTQIKWLQWSKEILTKAKSEEKPVLVFLRSSWCQACDTMEQTVFADPLIAASVTEHFIAVKVDSDHRPDLFARYSMGGWPSTVFLSSRGRVLAGGTFISVEHLRSALDEVSESYRNNRHEVESETFVGLSPFDAPSAVLGEVHWSFVEDTLDALHDHFDARHGGFERAPKFPRPDSILLALNASLWGFEDTQRFATHTLRALNAGQIHDHIEDGFFRYSSNRDWSSPRYEKTLEANARLLQCYLAGYGLAGTREFMTAAREIAEFLLDVLWLPDESLFGGSQHPGEDYFTADATSRRKIEPPPVDKTLLTGANALAAIGLVHLWWVTGNNQYLDTAKGVHATLTKRGLQPSGAVMHHFEGKTTGPLEGYLADQALAAMLTAEIYQATGELKHLDQLDKITKYCETNLVAPGGAMYDLAPDKCEEAGIRPLVPATDNALAARAYVLAWGVTGDDSHLDRARTILERVLPSKEPGIDDSALALAAGWVLRPVAVETGSRQTELALYAKRKMALGLAVRYDKMLENTAVVQTPGDTRARVAAQQDLERELMLALNPRRLPARERGARQPEMPHVH